MDDTQRQDPNKGAIDWHSQVARRFDARYSTDEVFQERFAIWAEAIARHSGPGKRALDVGCGPGQFLWLLAERNAEAVGVDGSDEMLRICREQMAGRGIGNVRLLQADIAALGGLGLGSFDVIIASSVLEYVADFDATLRSIGSLLRPGGRLVFSIPNRDSLVRRLHPILYRLVRRPAYFPLVRNLATERDIAPRLRGAGLALVATRHFAPTPLLSRLFRPLGLRAYCENLILVECVPAGAVKSPAPVLQGEAR